MKKFLGLSTLSLLIPFVANAHIGYVLSADEIAQGKGADFPYLLQVFQDSRNIWIMIITVLVVVLIGLFWKKIFIVKSQVGIIRHNISSYYEFIPWILRLSLGIALIGAGSAQILVSPSLSGFAGLATLQILLGFLLMAGFLLPIVAPVVLVLSLYALSKNIYLLGNFDFIASSFALLVLANPRPGVDDILGIHFYSLFKKLRNYVPFILRIGIGVAMMYLAVYEKFLNPHLSEMVVYNFDLMSVINVPANMWVFGAGAVELLIALLLLLGLFTRLVSTIAFIVLSFSFFYFGEDVYSHITLFGLLSILLITGGGKFSLDNLLKRK